MKRRLIWTAINGAMLLCLWDITAGSASVGVERVLSFVFIFFGITTTCAASMADAKAKLCAKGRSVPAWLSHTLGTVYVIWLVYLGFWTTAIFALLNEFAEYAIYDGPEVAEPSKDGVT